VHLTGEDLLRTRFTAEPAPLLETGLALAVLQGRDPVFGSWRRKAAAGLPAQIGPLLELIPPSATGPLFLDPVTTNLAEGLDQVQATSAEFAAEEIHRTFQCRPATRLARLLAARDRRAWRDLDQALRAAHQYLLADAWPRVTAGFRSELAWRGRLIAELGVQTALSALHPAMTWTGTVLQIDASDDFDMAPCGAGVTLLPSMFWTGRPLLTDAADGSAVIVYGALSPLPLIDEAPGDPLAELLGHTRAAVLTCVRRELTTSELASTLGISAASVSGHTKTLRSAGLIVTIRAGKSVLHSLTPLGDRLLQNTNRPAGPGQDPATGIPPS
jgi:DNA-binding transcriptional ArsR family regulator